MELECKCDYKANKISKVMKLDDKIKILGKLHGGMSAGAVGLTLH
jgi:hypothetical protein